MARQRDLDKLLSDLRSFLLILDQESLSAGARAKKKSVAELLSRLQSPPSEDAEYMIMRCLSPSPGMPQSPASPGARTVAAAEGRTCEHHPASTPSLRGGSKVLGVSPSPPADDSYEDAEPLGPGGCAGSGSDSSHYESYGEDEDGVMDRACYLQRAPATSPGAEAPGRPEPQLCGFLWRRRWLGQWAKQLFIIREHVLLCFRCAADPQPVLELDLRGCHVTYKAKRGKRMPHTLKVTGTVGEALVIGFQSRQQAEDWRKVIEEVSSDAQSGLAAISIPASPSSRLSRGAGSRLSKEEEEEEEEEENRSQQSLARSPRPGEDAKGGFLAVRLRGRWQRLWCAVRQGALRMFPEPGGTRRPLCALRLETCEVSPGAAAGSPQHLRIRIAQRGRELALLQTRSDEEREAWLKTLRARGGGEPAGDSPRAETPGLGNASSGPAAGGLLLRRIPTPNAYMDDPSGQLPPAETPKHLYTNVERLQQLQQSLDPAAPRRCKRPLSALPTITCSHTAGSTLPSQAAAAAAALRARAASPQRVKVSPELQNRDLPQSQHTLTLPERRGARDGLDILIGKRAFPKLEEKVGQLERGCRVRGRLKAGSEMNLLLISKSLRGHITASAAGSEVGLVPPSAAEAHGLSQEPPQAPALPGQRAERNRDAEEKGVGDEVCDVTPPPKHWGSPSPCRCTCRAGISHRLRVERAGPAWRRVLTTSINATATHTCFYIARDRDTHPPHPPHISALCLGGPCPTGSTLAAPLAHPSTSGLGHRVPRYNLPRLSPCWGEGLWGGWSKLHTVSIPPYPSPPPSPPPRPWTPTHRGGRRCALDQETRGCRWKGLGWGGCLGTPAGPGLGPGLLPSPCVPMPCSEL